MMDFLNGPKILCSLSTVAGIVTDIENIFEYLSALMNIYLLSINQLNDRTIGFLTKVMKTAFIYIHIHSFIHNKYGEYKK